MLAVPGDGNAAGTADAGVGVGSYHRIGMLGDLGKEQCEGIGEIFRDPHCSVGVGLHAGWIAAKGRHEVGADEIGFWVQAAHLVGAGGAHTIEVALGEPDVAGGVDAELLNIVVGVFEGEVPLGDGSVGSQASDAAGYREPLAAVSGDLDEKWKSAGGDGVFEDIAGGWIQVTDGEVGAVASGSAEPAPAKPAKPRKSQGDQGSLL